MPSFLRVYVVITACAYPGSTRARGVPNARVTWLERVTGPRFCTFHSAVQYEVGQSKGRGENESRAIPSNVASVTQHEAEKERGKARKVRGEGEGKTREGVRTGSAAHGSQIDEKTAV